MWRKFAASMVAGLILVSASAASSRVPESEGEARTSQDAKLKATCSFRVVSQKWIMGDVTDYQNYRKDIIQAINQKFGFKEFRDYILDLRDSALNLLVFSKNICDDTMRLVDNIHPNEAVLSKLDESTTNKLIGQIEGK